MRCLSVLLALLISLPASPWATAQTPAPALNILVLEGEGAINNIKQRTSRETIVQVEDENHKPVAGAAVVFAIPSQGAGGAVGGAGQTFTTVTNAEGRAVMKGFHPNNVQGQYQIHVTASKNGQTANAVINQSNALVGGAAAGASAGISGKLIAIIAIAGAAAAGGAIYATQRGGGNGTTSVPTISIAPGAGTVGTPK